MVDAQVTSAKLDEEKEQSWRATQTKVIRERRRGMHREIVLSEEDMNKSDYRSSRGH